MNQLNKTKISPYRNFVVQPLKLSDAELSSLLSALNNMESSDRIIMPSDSKVEYIGVPTKHPFNKKKP